MCKCMNLLLYCLQVSVCVQVHISACTSIHVCALVGLYIKGQFTPMPHNTRRACPQFYDNEQD